MRRSRSVFAEKKPRRTGWIAYVLMFLFILAAAVALNFINNGRVVVVQQDVTVTSLQKDLEKYRILHISDLHGNEFGPNQSTIATMLKTARYNAVCVTGDVCAPDGSYDAFLKLIDLFAPAVPVFFIAGDEDPEPILTSDHGEDAVKADYVLAAEAHGAVYLDSPQRLQVGKCALWFSPESIYGLDIESSRAAYLARRESLLGIGSAMTPDESAQLRAVEYRLGVLQAIEDALQAMQPEDIQIALTHHPLTEDTIKTLQQWAGAERNDFLRGVALVLAGHYNAGQLRLPFGRAIRALDSAGGGWFPADRQLVGLSTVQGVTQYISPGLGASGAYPIRFRLFNTPAVTVLTLTSALSF